jgi:hypothetical protein
VSQELAPCTIRDRGKAVVVVLCPQGQSQDKWKEAGEVACNGIRPCSAWIWDDPDKAPQKAPAIASGIPKDNILASIAIWDNDAKQLVMINKESK